MTRMKAYLYLQITISVLLTSWPDTRQPADCYDSSHRDASIGIMVRTNPEDMKCGLIRWLPVRTASRLSDLRQNENMDIRLFFALSWCMAGSRQLLASDWTASSRLMKSWKLRDCELCTLMVNAFRVTFLFRKVFRNCLLKLLLPGVQVIEARKHRHYFPPCNRSNSCIMQGNCD